MSIKDWEPTKDETLPRREGPIVGKSVESRMLQKVGGADGLRTKIRSNPDGSTTTLRTRNGNPKFTTTRPEKVELIEDEPTWIYDFNSVQKEGGEDYVSIPKAPNAPNNMNIYSNGFKIRRKGLVRKSSGTFALKTGESKYTSECRGPNYWYNETDLVTWHGIQRSPYPIDGAYDPPIYNDREMNRGAVQEGWGTTTDIVLVPYPLAPQPDTRIHDYDKVVIAACVVRSPVRGKLTRIASIHQHGTFFEPETLALFLTVQDYAVDTCVEEFTHPVFEVNILDGTTWSPDGCSLLVAGRLSDEEQGVFLVSCSLESPEFTVSMHISADEIYPVRLGFTKDNVPCASGYGPLNGPFMVYQEGAVVFSEGPQTEPVAKTTANGKVFYSFSYSANQHCFYTGLLGDTTSQSSYEQTYNEYEIPVSRVNATYGVPKIKVLRDYVPVSSYRQQGETYVDPLVNTFKNLSSTLDWDEEKKALLVLNWCGGVVYQKKGWREVTLSSLDWASLNYESPSTTYAVEMCFFSNLSHY